MLPTWTYVTGTVLTDHEIHERFEEFYDAVNEPIQLGGIDGQEPIEVSASSVPKARDPILYADQLDRWVWLLQSGWNSVPSPWSRRTQFRSVDTLIPRSSLTSSLLT